MIPPDVRRAARRVKTMTALSPPINRTPTPLQQPDLSSCPIGSSESHGREQGQGFLIGATAGIGSLDAVTCGSASLCYRVGTVLPRPETHCPVRLRTAGMPRAEAWRRPQPNPRRGRARTKSDYRRKPGTAGGTAWSSAPRPGIDKNERSRRKHFTHKCLRRLKRVGSPGVEPGT